METLLKTSTRSTSTAGLHIILTSYEYRWFRNISRMAKKNLGQKAKINSVPVTVVTLYIHWPNLVGGFNPSEKILVKMGIFPQIGLKITIYLKPPPRHGCTKHIGPTKPSTAPGSSGCFQISKSKDSIFHPRICPSQILLSKDEGPLVWLGDVSFSLAVIIRKNTFTFQISQSYFGEMLHPWKKMHPWLGTTWDFNLWLQNGMPKRQLWLGRLSCRVLFHPWIRVVQVV